MKEKNDANMPKMISDLTIRISPKECEYFKSINVYKPQRPLRPKHVDELCDKLNDGRFRTGLFGIAILSFDYEYFDTASGKNKTTRKLLMNGQHQAQMGINTGCTFSATVEEFAVVDRSQLAVLFAQYDPKSGARSNSDIVNAFEIPAIDKISGYDKASVISCVFSCIKGKQVAKDTLTEQKSAIVSSPEYQKALSAIYDLCYSDNGKKNRSHMRRGGVYGAIFITYMTMGDRCISFWKQISYSAELKVNSPAHTLHDYLMKSVVGNTRGNGKKRVTTDEIAHRCIAAWNAYANGLETYKFGRVPKGWPVYGDVEIITPK